ncbi:MAG: FAD-binding protein [Pseudomonadota bacterium]|nr:FAD-binding protein [Pseudomonadota bacterium]
MESSEEARMGNADKNALQRILNNISGVNVDGAEGWENFSQSVKAPNSLVVQVHNSRQLSNVLRAIHDFNQNREAKITIRAVAGWNDEYRCSTLLSCCSPTARLEKYNESFSWSSSSIGDVIIRFSRRFHSISSVYEHNGISCVDVSAGVQIGDLNTALEKKGFGLACAPMIRYVTAVGLAATSGHGTGRNQPGFAGLIKSMTIYDARGEERIIDATHTDFEHLSAGHMGYFGIVTAITLQVTNQILLHEHRTSYQTISTLLGERGENLVNALQNNDYFTLLHMPSYLKDHQLSADHFPWQLRLSNIAANNTECTPVTELHPETWGELSNQEVTINLGATLLEVVVENSSLIPHFMKFGAKTQFGTSGETKHVVGPRSIISHSVAAFPRALDDITFVFPVKNDDLLGIAEHLLKIDALLQEFASRGQYPLTFMFYLRYLQGTNGGLSFTSHEPDERILAFDFVSHPDAPGWPEFKQALFTYFSSRGLKLKYHLGKSLPDPSLTYQQIYGEKIMEKMTQVLCQWHNVQRDQLPQIPFLTPLILNNLGIVMQPPHAEILHAERCAVTKCKPGDVARAHEILKHPMQLDATKKSLVNAECHQELQEASDEFAHKIKAECPFAYIEIEHPVNEQTRLVKKH